MIRVASAFPAGGCARSLSSGAPFRLTLPAIARMKRIRRTSNIMPSLPPRLLESAKIATPPSIPSRPKLIPRNQRAEETQKGEVACRTIWISPFDFLMDPLSQRRLWPTISGASFSRRSSPARKPVPPPPNGRIATKVLSNGWSGRSIPKSSRAPAPKAALTIYTSPITVWMPTAKVHSTSKPVHPRILKDHEVGQPDLLYRWQLNYTPEIRRHAEALDELASRLRALGWGIDFAAACGGDSVSHPAGLALAGALCPRHERR